MGRHPGRRRDHANEMIAEAELDSLSGSSGTALKQVADQAAVGDREDRCAPVRGDAGRNKCGVRGHNGEACEPASAAAVVRRGRTDSSGVGTVLDEQVYAGECGEKARYGLDTNALFSTSSIPSQMSSPSQSVPAAGLEVSLLSLGKDWPRRYRFAHFFEEGCARVVVHPS